MTTEPPWKGCCEYCGTRLKKHEKEHRFCEKCVGEDVYDDYYADTEESR